MSLEMRHLPAGIAISASTKQWHPPRPPVGVQVQEWGGGHHGPQARGIEIDCLSVFIVAKAGVVANTNKVDSEK